MPWVRAGFEVGFSLFRGTLFFSRTSSLGGCKIIVHSYKDLTQLSDIYRHLYYVSSLWVLSCSHIDGFLGAEFGRSVVAGVSPPAIYFATPEAAL